MAYGRLYQLLIGIGLYQLLFAEDGYKYVRGRSHNATSELSYLHPQDYIYNALSYNRIVGGVEVPISTVPYQVAIMKNNAFICGGAILHSLWILTAAHCVNSRGNYWIRAGSSTFKSGGQLRQVRSRIIHAYYRESTHNNDIALLRLSQPLSLNKHVQIVKLPLREDVPRVLLVAGWGTTSASAQQSQSRLRATLLGFANQNQCIANYNGIPITRNMFCAAGSGRDHCFGDSGGPLAFKGVTYGIVSFAIGCANPRYPGVNTRVARYTDWILRVIRSN